MITNVISFVLILHSFINYHAVKLVTLRLYEKFSGNLPIH
jgi:hypothetical protein